MLKILTNFSSSTILDIDLNQNISYIPKSESIKKYINTEIEKVLKDSILEDKDIEIISFRPEINYAFKPYSNNIARPGILQETSFYLEVGFSLDMLLTSNVFRNESFYLFDVYDNYIDGNQNLISRNFLKLSKINFTTDIQNDINFNLSTIQKEYTNIYIPSYYINNNINTFYFKIWFFNATNGKLRFFECSQNETDNLKNYFKIQVNKNDKTFKILNGDLINNNNNIKKTYKISQIIDIVKESKLNENINNIKPIIKQQKTITTEGKFI
jgi:hypothetical protein